MPQEKKEQEVTEGELKGSARQHQQSAAFPTPETREERLGVWADDPKLQ